MRHTPSSRATRRYPRSVGIDFDDGLNIVIGVLEVLLAAVVVRHIARFGRAFPWLMVLMAFFFVRGIDRIYAGISESDRLGWAVDVVALTCVVLLIVGIDKTVRALRASQDEAALRSEEYARALADYRRLARHRLANPLTAIKGSLATLRDMPELDPATQRELLAAAEEQAQRLEEVALDPEIAAAEERGLRPTPDV
jgi:signal transduction histidine kinase